MKGEWRDKIIFGDCQNMSELEDHSVQSPIDYLYNL